MDSSEFIPAEVLNEALAETWSMCKEMEADNEESMAKIIGHSLTGGHAMVCLADMPQEADQKRSMMRTIGLQLGQGEGQFIIFFLITEAWVSQMTPEHSERGLRPSEDPNRQEILLLSATALNGGQAFRMAEIVRHEDGTREFVDKFDMFQDFDDNRDDRNTSMGDHMLPELVRSYAMSVIARSQPHLQAQVKELLAESQATMLSPDEIDAYFEQNSEG